MQQKKGATVAYVRVSSTDQNLDRQFAIIHEAVNGNLDREFTERVSGKTRDGRTALAEMLSWIRDGDVVCVASFDRLARSLRDLQDIVQQILDKGASVRFLKERITFEPGETDKFSVFQMQILGAVAELERAIIRERQADGIAAAKAKGKYAGRARALNADQLAEAQRLIAEGVPKAEVSRRLGVGRATLYRSIARTAKIIPG